ncbi:DNA polymerase III subunit beta [Deinococcus sp. PEB2-67]
MRVSTTRNSLKGAMDALTRIIPQRSSSPLLTAVHITPSVAGLTFAGTNLEVDLQVFMPCEVLGRDLRPLAVPAHLFGTIVTNLGAELVELELHGHELSIRCGGSDAKIQCGDADAYPPLAFPDRTDFTLPAAQLLELIGSVRYAPSHEAFQAQLRAVNFTFDAERLTLIGSDGYRVAYRAMPAPGAPNGITLIPARSVDEVARALAGSDTVRVALPRDDEPESQGIVTLRGERIALRLKLMDGQFPDWQRVIPKQFAVTMTLSAVAAAEAVRRVALVADKNANNRLELHVTPGLMPALRLQADGDYGRAQDTIPLTQCDADRPHTYAYNARYLLDALGAQQGDITFGVGVGGVALLSGPGEDAPHGLLVSLRV